MSKITHISQNFINADSSNGKINDGTLGDIRKFINSFKSQDKSTLFDMWKLHFGSLGQGINADATINLFINGYNVIQHGNSHKELDTPDSKRGYLKPIFDKKLLANRTTISSLDNFGNTAKTWLQDGRALGISYIIGTSSNSHIINIWGAEYDENNTLTPIYISDSDDPNKDPAGMKRLAVTNNNNNKIRLTSSINPNHGPTAHELYSLSLGEDLWDAYFKKQQGN